MTLTLYLVVLLVLAAVCGAVAVVRRSRALGLAAGLIVAVVVVVVGAIAFNVRASAKEQAAGKVFTLQEFVGTTPCAEPVRSFVGGLTPGAACHSLNWHLTLSGGSGGTSSWKLSATYEIPAPSNPNAGVPGPRVSLTGRLESSAAAYRLLGTGSASPLVFSRVSDDLIHLLGENGRLAIGTAGWSYTLNRRDRAEQAGDPSSAADFSYAIKPVATGSGYFAAFEGRTPCRGIARELRGAEVPGCIKAKWRITLYLDPRNAEPGAYRVEGTLYRQAPRTGMWRRLRGLAADPGAVIYQLDATKTERPILLLASDPHVLFVLNANRQLLIGSPEFSYTLNFVGESSHGRGGEAASR